MSALVSSVCAAFRMLNSIHSQIWPTALNSNHCYKQVCCCHQHVCCLQNVEQRSQQHVRSSPQQQLTFATMSAPVTGMCAVFRVLNIILSCIWPTALNSSHSCKQACLLLLQHECWVQDTEPHPEPHLPNSTQQQPEPAGLRSHRGWQDQHSHACSAA